MSMDDGWFKIHRSIFHSWVYADAEGFKLWTWLIGHARITNGHVRIRVGKGTTTVSLKRGELIFGRLSAAEKLGMSDSKIYRLLKKFEKQNMIVLKPNSHYTIISICKYDIYQSGMPKRRTANEQPMNNHRTANEKPLNTNKKDLNIKKGKIPKYINDDLIKKIIEAFQDEYRQIRGRDYVITNQEKERNAVVKLLEIMKKELPDANPVDGVETLRHLFRLCLSVEDTWLYNNMSLPVIHSQFNQIQNILNSPKKMNNGKVYTYNQLCDLVTKGVEVFSDFEKDEKTGHWVLKSALKK